MTTPTVLSHSWKPRTTEEPEQEETHKDHRAQPHAGPPKIQTFCSRALSTRSSSSLIPVPSALPWGPGLPPPPPRGEFLPPTRSRCRAVRSCPFSTASREPRTTPRRDTALPGEAGLWKWQSSSNARSVQAGLPTARAATEPQKFQTSAREQTDNLLPASPWHQRRAHAKTTCSLSNTSQTSTRHLL